MNAVGMTAFAVSRMLLFCVVPFASNEVLSSGGKISLYCWLFCVIIAGLLVALWLLCHDWKFVENVPCGVIGLCGGMSCCVIIAAPGGGGSCIVGVILVVCVSVGTGCPNGDGA